MSPVGEPSMLRRAVVGSIARARDELELWTRAAGYLGHRPSELLAVVDALDPASVIVSLATRAEWRRALQRPAGYALSYALDMPDEPTALRVVVYDSASQGSMPLAELRTVASPGACG